jgi:hypothetical protein
MRDPDPKVDIRVYGANGSLVNSILGYDLNTVEYSRNGEIRITITSSVAANIVPMSILVMERIVGGNVDYRMDFYAPGSVGHSFYQPMLVEKMPNTTRMYGWI